MREMTYSKSNKRERGLTQNPAREREEFLKIQQEREMTYSKSSKRESDGVELREREREREREGEREREEEYIRYSIIEETYSESIHNIQKSNN